MAVPRVVLLGRIFGKREERRCIVNRAAKLSCSRLRDSHWHMMYHKRSCEKGTSKICKAEKQQGYFEGSKGG
jgi:hypothetical protein